MASASQDLRVLRVLLETKEYDDAQNLKIPDVLQRGSRVYLATRTMKELMGSNEDDPICLQDAWSCDAETVRNRLSSEQWAALQAVLQTPRSLFTLSASAGAGKSYLFGAILALWLQWAEVSFPDASSRPIAVIATSRAQHRGDLRRNVTKFLPPDVVYILESMTDFDQDLDESFWQAASSEQARKSEAGRWSQLASLDATVDNTSRGHAERLRSLAARTALLWEGILWTRGQVLQDFLLNKLRVLIVTSDKSRKTLGASSSWFHQRPLGILLQDEYENEGFLDFVSLIIHFNTVITGGDPRQVLKRNFLPSTRLPLPQQEETQGISLEDEPVTDWLEARSCVVRMETSYRLGPAVRERVDEIFPHLGPEASAPRAKRVCVCGGGGGSLGSLERWRKCVAERNHLQLCMVPFHFHCYACLAFV